MLDYISFALELSEGIIKKYCSMSGVFRYYMSLWAAKILALTSGYIFLESCSSVLSKLKMLICLYFHRH